MFIRQIASAAGLLFTLAATSPTKRCFGPVIAIYARGTDPNMGTATQNDPNPTDPELASIASSGVPAASVTALSYPAAGIQNTADYHPSWSMGIDNLQGLIKYIVDNTCSGTKIVLLGYSQGASVITGAVAGGQGRPALTGQYLDAIAGGVAIADPSFVAGLSPLDDFSENKSIDGSIPDGNVQQNLNRMKGNKFASLCENNDFYCASAGQNGDPGANIHIGEEKFWHDRAVTFLQGLGL